MSQHIDYPQTTPPKTSKKKNIIAAAICGLLVLLCGSFGLYVEAHKDIDTLPFTTPLPLSNSPMTTIAKDGRWTVGSDIVAGTYRTSTGGSKCVWGITKTDPTDSKIKTTVSAGIYMPVITITLTAKEDFESYFCGTWVRQL